MMYRSVTSFVFFSLVCSLSISAQAQDIPLPSWNDGKSRQEILDFVERVTTKGGPDFVEPSARIAVFDNDGTLWSEKPFYFQLYFAMDQVKALQSKHPEWRTQEPFASVLQGDTDGVLKGGERALLELVMATHAGMTTEDFEQTVAKWIATARHPETQKRFMDMVYQPMLELLDYLRSNDFKTYIVSGGGIEFMRPWAERVYGVPPEQVIGSSVKTQWTEQEGAFVLKRLPQLSFLDDKEGKPVAINLHIGRRPIAAFGNSDGDLQMLQWTTAGKGPRFAALVRHTDPEREWSYDRNSHVGRLDKALEEASKRGWTVMDMKREWKNIYPQLP